MPDTYLAEPAIHPRLRDSSQLAGIRADFLRQGWVRIEQVLEPGLAAELGLVLAQLPIGLSLQGGRAELCWGGALLIPAEIDPQHPEPLYRLVRFFSRDVPALLAVVAGLRLRAVEPQRAHLYVYRRGCYREAPAPDDERPAVTAELGLTPGAWPHTGGGHAELVDPSGALVERLAPGWDTLDLYGAGLGVRVPMIQRPVQVIALRSEMAEEQP